VVTVIAVVATVAACAFALLAWAQHREAARRSTARVAALAAAIDWEARDHAATPAMSRSLDAFDVESASHGALFAGNAKPPRHWWMVAAGAVPVALIVAALLVARGPHAAPAPGLQQPESLELLAMRHDARGGTLTVTGTVRVRGLDAAPVTAVVTGRDREGHIVASAHAPLDDAGLDRNGEASFQVAVPGGSDVRRYQVRFETPLGPLTHVDRRTKAPAASVQP
jgi:hypothetical protein